MTDMERILESQTVEGEIGLVIDYEPGKSSAIHVLQSAMNMIEALDKLDSALLSSIDSSLEPVSVLNDVQHSSLKLLLARALRKLPDEHIKSLDWKKWAGALLVKGKYKLLQKLDADAPEIRQILVDLEPDYKSAPGGLIGYTPPTVSDVIEALDGISKARSAMPHNLVTIQTELGDVILPDAVIVADVLVDDQPQQTVTNTGVEFFKVKAPDMLGSAQWSLLRNNRSVKVDMLHQNWIDAYHRREHSLLPGDSLKCQYEETITYDSMGNELERKLAIIEVISIISPPTQINLL
jgi:hypothetical protein